jgi:hypothetical protein
LGQSDGASGAKHHRREDLDPVGGGLAVTGARPARHRVRARSAERDAGLAGRSAPALPGAPRRIACEAHTGLL